MIRDNATQNQVDAASPFQNTWLTANAGSGKTKVLTDRVARLLLNGVQPQNILCLTYTKAAASEMQNRLFKRLGAWSMQADETLELELRQLGEGDGSINVSIEDARRLFARAIETPGGLKIQTIHSFCAKILRQFPLEAGVSPQFTELDEAAMNKIQRDVLDSIAGGADVAVLRDLLENHAVSDIEALVAVIANSSQSFLSKSNEDDLRTALKLADSTSKVGLATTVFSQSNLATLEALKSALKDGSEMDQRALKKLNSINLSDPRVTDLAVLENIFLTGPKGTKKLEPFAAKIDGFPTKATRDALGAKIPALNDLMSLIEDLREQRLALLTFERTRDFHRFANLFANKYAERKINLGVLDFDDLITKTKSLLENPDVAQWILFRLDGGIDHLLVDEAQDTSPEQWAIVRALTDEFASGNSSRQDVERTIFVVGDKKQSIYSFQGADPVEFDRLRDHFKTSLAAADSHLQLPSLQHSFRSSVAILRVVDETFVRERAESVGSSGEHIAFKTDLPGRVDLWNPIEVAEVEPPDSKWFEPVDRLSDTHHNVRLAKQIASQIARIIDEDALPMGRNTDGSSSRRNISEGDFLILVQRRSELFSEIIRACKKEGLNVAGADRLELKAELAVKDILAVLNFLALPEDSLSLASALRSPLFSWSEQELYDLAQKRSEKHLWAALRNSTGNEETLEILNDLRSVADFFRPYEIIDRLLRRHDGRRRLISRLGEEATDGIDAILSQALSYEQSNIPSLTGFLGWFESYAAEVKRQVDSKGDQIRIMTVHGAKGLEAPIVILPDTAVRRNTLRDMLVEVGGIKMWKPSAGEVPKSISLAQDLLQKKQADERLRLLYVAMTRAENWLIVAAAGNVGTGDDSWYNIVSSGLEHAGTEEISNGELQLLRHSHGDWMQGVVASPHTASEISTSALKLQELQKQEPENILTPSGLGGQKIIATPGSVETDGDGKEKGNLIHLLLEHLPKYPAAKRRQIGLNILERQPIDDDIGIAVLDSAIAMIGDPQLNWIFAEDTFAEVEIAGKLSELNEVKVNGIIDRLIVSDEVVTIVDYKSNEVVPDTPEKTPEGILRQLGLYAAVISQIYPQKVVKTAILWTEHGQLMDLPSELISAALARVNQP